MMKSAEQLKADFGILIDGIFSADVPEDEKKELLADMVAAQFFNGWYCGYNECKKNR